MTAMTSAVARPDGELPIHLWLPPAGSGPGLLLLQEIFGVSGYIRQRAQDLADLGYVVMAPELYWRVDGEIDDTADDALDQGMALLAQLDWDDALADAAAALEALRGRDETTGGVGAIGFCFGGGLAFNLVATTPVDALVSYYGSALPRLLHLADKVTVPTLHHFGTADGFIPLPTVLEIRDAVAGPHVDFRLHEGADHAFDNPMPRFVHPEARETAWRQTADFLARHLPA